MIHLFVWITLPRGEQELVGEAAFEDPDSHGRYRSEFRYARAWLSERAAFAIDPVHLGLADMAYAALNLDPPLSVFDDALPDDWGRRLLARAHRLSPRERNAPNLLRVLAGNAVGALGFGDPDGPPPATHAPIGSVHLAGSLEVALALESSSALTRPGLDRLLSAVRLRACLGVDLVPDDAERRQRSLAFQYEQRTPDRATLAAIGRARRLREFDSIIARVLDGVSRFVAVARMEN